MLDQHLSAILAIKLSSGRKITGGVVGSIIASDHMLMSYYSLICFVYIIFVYRGGLDKFTITLRADGKEGVSGLILTPVHCMLR
jgi:hypothetical protein